MHGRHVRAVFLSPTILPPFLSPFLPPTFAMLQGIKPLAGESFKSFSKRVRAEATKKIREIKATMPAFNHVSDKRKEYLEARADKKKAKKLGVAVEDLVALKEQEKQEEKEAAAAAHKLSGKKRRREKDGEEDGDAAEGSASAAAAAASSSSAAAPAAGPRLGALTLGGKGPALSSIPSFSSITAAPELKRDYFPTDHVAFGERADRPPTALPVPRLNKVREGEGGRWTEELSAAAAVYNTCQVDCSRLLHFLCAEEQQRNACFSRSCFPSFHCLPPFLSSLPPFPPLQKQREAVALANARKVLGGAAAGGAGAGSSGPAPKGEAAIAAAAAERSEALRKAQMEKLRAEAMSAYQKMKDMKKARR